MPPIKIEEKIALSQSCLWQAQRHYFEEEGIHAWQQVPFFVSSNPFIADRYARLIAAYLQDIDIDPAEPVYIVELGSGTGQFSYYCNLALKKYLQHPHFSSLKICYVMTDFTVSNQSFWEEQAVFAPWFADGSLDTALLDIEAPEPLFLLHQQRSLERLKNPLIVIANYVFDSVRHDLFSIHKGQVHESLIDTYIAPEDYAAAEQKILGLKNISFRYQAQPLVLQEEPLAALLQFYQDHLKESEFSIPTSTLHLLDFFKDYAPAGVLTISSDKGLNHLDEFPQVHPRDLVFHGSFSFEVNFHAIAVYQALQGGRACLQSYREGLKTNLFLSKAQETPYLDQAFTDHVDTFGPADYFRSHTHFKNQLHFDPHLALAQLRLSEQDPYVFSLMLTPLCQCISTQSLAIQNAFVALIPQIFKQIYPLPESPDHAFNLGFFLHTLHRYQEAIPYYEASLQHTGERYDSCFNLGICFSYSDLVQSQVYFEKARALAKVKQS